LNPRLRVTGGARGVAGVVRGGDTKGQLRVTANVGNHLDGGLEDAPAPADAE